MGIEILCDICNCKMEKAQRRWIQFLDLKEVCPDCIEVFIKARELMRMPEFRQQLKDLHSEFARK